jgi:hypothetical protein
MKTGQDSRQESKYRRKYKRERDFAYVKFKREIKFCRKSSESDLLNSRT